MLTKAIKSVIKRAETKGERLHRTKTVFAENIAISRKTKLYKSVSWTDEQKNEFSAHCKELYGKSISSRWHKLYQSINGCYDVNYVPEKILTTVIEPNANRYNYCRTLEDKNLLSSILGSSVKTPECIVSNSNGIFYDGFNNIVPLEEAVKVANNCGYSVIKPTINTSSGKNVRFLNVVNGVDLNTNMHLKDLFDKYNQNFVLQKKLNQCKEVSDIHPHSLNTFRITTYVLNGEIYTVPAALRFGSNKSNLDNIHAGGFGIAVSDEGVLGKYAYKLGRGDSKVKIEKHPNTGIVFDGYKIPKFNRVLEASKIAHSKFVGIGIISWDIIIDQNYDPVIIEANLIGQGYWFPQVLHGKGPFGKNTKEFIHCYYRK